MPYKNIEDKKLYSKAYYLKNAEKLKAAARINFHQNSDRENIRRKKHYHSHRETALIYRKQYYNKNREQLLEYARKYREIHNKAINKSISDYLKTEAGKIITHRKRIKRRFNKMGAELIGSHTSQEWQDKVNEYEGRCSVCAVICTIEKSLQKTTLTKDHVIPISKGGSDSIENIVPMCLSCNASKGNRL